MLDLTEPRAVGGPRAPASHGWWNLCEGVWETENTGRPLVGRGRISLRIRPPWQAFFIVSVAQSCPALCDRVDCSTPGFPVLHHLRIFHTLSLILTATSVRVAITTIPITQLWKKGREELRQWVPGHGWQRQNQDWVGCLYWKCYSFPSSGLLFQKALRQAQWSPVFPYQPTFTPSCPLPPSFNGLLVGSTFLTRLGPHLQWGLG